MHDFHRTRASRRAYAGAAAAIILLLAHVVPATAEQVDDRVRDNLYGAKFVTPQSGWAVGAFGVITHTGDGGASWHMQQSRTTEQLFDVDFVDDQHGWVVGRSGLILRTQDGGATWSKQSSSTDKHLFSVDFADAQAGVAVGDWGAVVVTADGGTTWEARSLEQDVILNDIQMLDRSTGFTVGEVGTVLKTEDGGKTWSQRPNQLTKTLFSLRFRDAQQGWVAGLDGLIARTGDGGVTWEIQHGSTEVGGLEQVQFAQSVENPSLYAIAVAGDRGFAVGETGAIFASPDGGQSWARQKSPSLNWLRALSLVPGNHGIAVGAGGRRVRIVDGAIQVAEEAHAAEAPR